MKSDKQKKALELFESIGQIDDSLLQEAMEYRPRRLSFSRFLPLAAALLLCVILSVSILTVALRNTFPPPPAAESSKTLDEALLALRDQSTEVQLEAESDIPFFDGSAYLVWQYESDGTLCISRPLNDDEVKLLGKHFGQGERIGSESTPLSCRVWLLVGNGDVYSPYLPYSAGNVGKANLFDYEAELLPTDAFVATVSDILENPTN